jgi:hypothetical protein
MVYEAGEVKVNFYSTVADMTVEEFIRHERHHGLTEDQLRQAHGLCVKAEKKPTPRQKQGQ